MGVVDGHVTTLEMLSTFNMSWTAEDVHFKFGKLSQNQSPYPDTIIDP